MKFPFKNNRNKRPALDNFKGALIEESLENKGILKKIRIVSTRIEKVTEKHKTPWLSRWTLHTIEIPESEAEKMAEEISESLDRAHSGSWYADFRNSVRHYIIFCGKVFSIDRKDEERYNEATRYGVSLGIPKYQLGFYTEAEK
jgi:hypothetical protein